MRAKHVGWWIAAALFAAAAPQGAQAQMSHNSTPFGAGHSSFFERIGTSWGASGKNWHFDVGGGGAPQSPFGGGANAPNAGASGGFAVIGPKARGYFTWEASQGSNNTYTNQTPSVTTLNGYPGFVADVSQSPFVVSVVPVVGAGGVPAVAIPQYTSQEEYEDLGTANTILGRARRGELPPKLASALRKAYAQPGDPDPSAQPQARAEAPAVAAPQAAGQQPPLQVRPRAASPAAGNFGGGEVGPSTADAPAESLAAIRARKGAPIDPDADARGLLEKGRAAQADGKWGAARIYYQMAVKQASSEPLRQEARTLLSAAQQKK